MVQKVGRHKTTDGKYFTYANAAKRYERGYILGRAIDQLDAPESTKKFLKKNWNQLRGLQKRFGNVNPYEKVPDKKKLG